MPGVGINLRMLMAAARGVPVTPSLLIADPISPTQIDTMWLDNSGNETGFELQYDTSNSFPSPTTLNTAADATSQEVTGLIADTTYYFRVRAISASGDSGWSNTAEATTYPAVPVTGYELWLRGDSGTFQDTGGLTPAGTDNDPVARWEDRSSNGNHFTQGTAGNQPALRTGTEGIGGYGAIEFDGNDQLVTSLLSVTSGDYTIFVVWESTGVNENLLDSQTGRLIVRTNGAIGAYYDGAWRGSQVTVSGPKIVSWVLNSASGASVRENSYVSQSGLTYNQKALGGTTSLGSNYSASGGWSTGKMAEIIVYPNVLSEADIATVEGYLAGRYGIPLETAGTKIVWLKSDTEVYEETTASTLATDDADTVGYWKDQSGKGNHFTADGDNTTRPTLKTNLINNLPVIRADGSNDRLRTIQDIILEEFTVILVVIPHVMNTPTRIYYHQDGSGGWRLESYVEDAVEHIGPNVAIDGSIDLNVASIITVERSSSAITVRRNGEQVATDTLASVPQTIDEIFLFCTNSLTAFTEVDIAELIVMRGTDSTRRDHNEAYLSHRYGIDILTGLRWTQLSSLPIMLEQMGFEELGGLLYVCGGVTTGGTDSAKIYAYDPSTDTWDTTLTDMPSARQSGVFRAVGNKLYYIGGLVGGTTFVDTVYEYDPAVDSWSTMTAMTTAREDMGSCVIDGKVYVFGGLQTGATHTNELAVYDPATDSWDDTVTDMPAAKLLGDFGAAYNGKAYAIGGSDDYTVYPGLSMDTNVYEYDPSGDSWSIRATAIPAPKAYKDVAVIGSNMYVIGGAVLHRDRNVNSVWKYNASADSWVYIGVTPQPISHQGAAVYNGSVYMVGGQTDGNTRVDELWRLDP